jgi:hypothetical protein
MKSPSGRTAELARIALKGAELVYQDWAWIAPNIWVSPSIVHEFESRGLIERKGNRARVTEKGLRVLGDLSTR